MGNLETKSLDTPDEKRDLPEQSIDIVSIGSMTLGRSRMEPGWRWSKDAKPVVGTEQCMVLHRGYCISGQLNVRSEDGNEIQIGAGDAYLIEPGHDGWVLGDEPYIAVDFSDHR